jgi:hypothetical protein
MTVRLAWLAIAPLLLAGSLPAQTEAPFDLVLEHGHRGDRRGRFGGAAHRRHGRP